jgi:hypothetical protein
MMRRLLAFALVLLGLALCDQASAGQTVTGIACSRSVLYDASTNGATQLVASGSTIYICGYKIATNAAINVGLVFGTGTNCATGQTKITPAFAFAANTAGIGSIGEDTQQFRGLTVPPGQALCINTSAGSAVQAIVYFDQF